MKSYRAAHRSQRYRTEIDILGIVSFITVCTIVVGMLVAINIIFMG